MREVKRSALVAQPPSRAVRAHQRYRELSALPALVHPRARADRAPSARSLRRIGVKQGPLHGEFTTRNELEPDTRILMQLVSGPFRTLEGEWLLTPIGADGCRVELTMRFAFTNRLSGDAVRAEVRARPWLAGRCLRRPRARALPVSMSRASAAWWPTPTRERQYLWTRRACRGGDASRDALGGRAASPRRADGGGECPGTAPPVGIFGEPCERAPMCPRTAIASSSIGR